MECCFRTYALAGVPKGHYCADDTILFVTHGGAGIGDVKARAILPPKHIVSHYACDAVEHSGVNWTLFYRIRRSVRPGVVHRCMSRHAEKLSSGSAELGCGGAIFECDVSFDIDAVNSFTNRFQDQFALTPELPVGLSRAFTLYERADLTGGRMKQFTQCVIGGTTLLVK